MSDFKTFSQWNALGYKVPRDGSATHYLVGPEGGQQRVPVWTEDQVEKIIDTWTLTKKEDLPPSRGGAVKGPHFLYAYENGRMNIHVSGSHTEVVALLKKIGYKANPSTWRWSRDASAAQRDALIKRIEGMGFVGIDENEDESL